MSRVAQLPAYCVSVMVPLVDVVAARGPTEYAPGTHVRPRLLPPPDEALSPVVVLHAHEYRPPPKCYQHPGGRGTCVRVKPQCHNKLACAGAAGDIGAGAGGHGAGELLRGGRHAKMLNTGGRGVREKLKYNTIQYNTRFTCKNTCSINICI